MVLRAGACECGGVRSAAFGPRLERVGCLGRLDDRWNGRAEETLNFGEIMKPGIHPAYELMNVKCSCGNNFETRSTAKALSVELCNECHPFYTGKQKLVDTGGRVDRFNKRYGTRPGAKAAE
jgi:large subunit ribosomal protein L31